MNSAITYIPNSNSNSLNCLDTSLLSDYLLTEEEQQYISNLERDTNSFISTCMLSASLRAGSDMYNQQSLNSIYLRQDNPNYNANSKNDLKHFLNTQLVGKNIVNFTELEN